MDKILEVKNLKVSYHTYAGEVQSVRGVSFDLYKGETLGIVGESGCGKTVTSKALMRLIQAPQGEIKRSSEIVFNSKNILSMNKNELRNLRGGDISMIFQDPMTSLNPTAKIGDQIAESLIIHRGLSKGDALKEAKKILELVRIPNVEKRINQYPHQFSGGMRQRVSIAIALACNPKILIADEPTTALDVTIQAQIMDLMKDLQKKLGTSIIMITHDLGLVATMTDRVQVMYSGLIVERGTTEDIFYYPKHPYTWALIKSVPGLSTKNKASLYSISGTPPDLLNPPVGCPFAARCQYCMEACLEMMPEVTTISDTHSVSCWLMHPDAPKIESTFAGGGAV